MITSAPASGTNVSLMGIEGSLTILAVAVSFAWPNLCSGLISKLEKHFRRLARRRTQSVAIVGLTAILLRLAILPLHPVPLPSVSDDFSNLLAADTFAHRHLTNPTPAMWVHFETIHIDMKPTYTSMYFPAQGLVMAAGIVLFGHPWFGILIFGGLMCGALCWMLQAWLPPSWALLGGFLAVLRLALFSYWTNTYHTAGVIAALGGALVLGSLPRFKRGARSKHLLLLAAGIVILVLTPSLRRACFCVFLWRLFLATGSGPRRSRQPAGSLLRRVLPGSGAAPPRCGVAGLLRQTGVRQPVHSALQREPCHVRDGPVLRVAEASP